MSSGDIALTQQIARLRELDHLVERSAPKVAAAMRQEILAQVARQQGPDGKPWPPTKAGTPALKNAAASLSVRAVGTVILARLQGRHARHHLGAVKGKTKRPILPSGKIPDPVTRAITRVVTGEFKQIMGVG